MGAHLAQVTQQITDSLNEHLNPCGSDARLEYLPLYPDGSGRRGPTKPQQRLTSPSVDSTSPKNPLQVPLPLGSILLLMLCPFTGKVHSPTLTQPVLPIQPTPPGPQPAPLLSSSDIIQLSLGSATVHLLSQLLVGMSYLFVQALSSSNNPRDTLHFTHGRAH